MSQQKVDRYKKDKANRKSIIRKQKIKNLSLENRGHAIWPLWYLGSGIRLYKTGSQPAEIM